MKWQKVSYWTRKSDALYLLYMPLEIIKTIPYILIGEPQINEMTWHEYIDLAKSQADVRTGRMWELISWD